jgi:hypothetical protein
VPAGTLPTDIAYWKQVIITPGFNSSTLTNLKFDVTTTRANALVDGNGDLKTADTFISNSGDASINGTLTITNVVPLILGGSTQSQVTVSNALFELASNISDQNFQVSSKNAANGLQASIFVNANNEYVGIYTNTPSTTLDVNGDTRIRGSLTVEGNLTSVNTINIEIADKLIELAKVASPSNTTADGGGISLEGGLDGDKTLLWSSTIPGWTSSENFNIASSKAYYINGIQTLNYTTLGSSVINSSLTGVGTLRTLQVYSNAASCGTSIDGNTISYTSSSFASGDVVLLPKGTGNVNVSSRKIINVSNAQDPTDAVNLQTVQSLISSAPLGLSADTAFLAGVTLDADIGTQIIEKVYPAITHQIGTECRIWCIDLGIAKLYTIAPSGFWAWSANL